MNDSIGDVMSEGRNNALKALAILAGVVVYLGMIAYSAVHNWRLMTAGVPDEMVIWAALGVVALEISAVALPVALHWWTHADLQRITAFAFYGLDLLLIFANVVLDYSLNTGGELPGWLQMYLFYGVPATPVLAGLGWSLLFLLDPSQRERATVETLRASTREVLAKRIAAQARSADISETVELAAANMARDIVAQTLGSSATRTLPAGVVEASARDPLPRERKRRPVVRPPRWKKTAGAAINYSAEAEKTDGFFRGERNGKAE